MGTWSTRSSSKKSSSFLLPEEIDNLSALLENPDPLYNPDLQNTGAIPKKKSAKKTSYSHTDDPSASVENLICLEVLRKENLATQPQITETKLNLAQLNANVSSPASDAVAATPPSSLTKLWSAIVPNASSSPCLPSEFAEIPSLDQLRSRKKAGASLPNNFLFSPKGTVDYNKLESAEFVCGYLEFCKEQPESSKAPLLKHLHLLTERAITYSWSSVRNFHLSVNNAIEQGRLSWQSYESIRKRAQTFFTHQDLRSNLPTSSRNGSIPARRKAKDLLCREWNNTGKCSCAISDASYKAVHRCRVCDSPDHAMLTCAKPKYPIPASQSASSSTSSSTGADQSSWLRSLVVLSTKVRAFGLPNFLGAKHLVPSRFNVDVWSHYLEHYQDRVIIDFLRYGWPINYQSDVLASSSFHNHPSAVKNLSYLSTYIAKELSYQSVFGPFH